MSQPANLDPARLTFDEFVRFFFDHPKGEQFWYADARYALSDFASSAPQLLNHMIELLSDFGTAVRPYSPEQISHGIWAMFSPSFSLSDALWDANLPLEKRLQSIGAMGTMFTSYVVEQDAEPLQKSFYMWWHIIVTGFWAHQGQFETPDLSQLDAESTALLQAVFETLKQILSVSDPRVQGYALHGLGHLHHPGVRELVQHYLDNNKDRFTEEHVQWIEQCRDGIVS
jgi:hypothetical protein